MKTIIMRTILDVEGGDDYGPEARARFTMPNGVVIEICRAGRQDPEGTLTIRALNGTLAVAPRADNTISVMSKHEARGGWEPSGWKMSRMGK